jgi:hypothetical protein
MAGAKKKNVYIVMGSTGEYSDRSEWPVVAYLNEEHAKEHVEKATAYAKEFEVFAQRDEFRHNTWDKRRELTVSPFDPRFSMDYTGTSYWYDEVPLLREVKKFEQ